MAVFLTKILDLTKQQNAAVILWQGEFIYVAEVSYTQRLNVIH